MRRSSSTWPRSFSDTTAAVLALAIALLALIVSLPVTAASRDGAAVSPSTSAAAAVAKPAPAVPDRFTAKTGAMTPAGVGLRVDVTRWSDDAGRAAVVAALGSDNPLVALSKLPTLGYVWTDGMPLGMSIKYARRVPMGDGERITLVTDRPLGAYSYKPWAVNPPLVAKELPYGVLELYLDRDGKGSGTLSLAADVKIDAAAALVTLADDAPRLLDDAKLEPKPYYAREGH